MCTLIPSQFCTCTDYLLPEYEKCHPIMCHSGSICRLRKLLDEPMSANCYEQQMFYLFDYIKFCKDGFFLTDLIHLSRVFEVIAGRIDSARVYRPYFKKLLDIACLPPVKHNCGEELSEATHFSEYLSVLGFLGIWLSDIKLRHRVYNAIIKVLTTKEANLATAKLSFRHKAAEDSHLPEIFAQILDLASNDEYIDVLNVALVLTEISPKICEKMALVNTIDYLLIRLLPNEKVGQDMIKKMTHSENYIEVFNITCQILINIVSNIKNLSDEILNKITPCQNSIWAIRYIFRGLLYGKHSQLPRNNLMAFIMLCLYTFPRIDITSSYLLDDIASLSIASEIDSDTWVKEIPFTNSENDVFFKRMLVLTLSFARKYHEYHLIYQVRNVVPGLIKILALDYVTNWHKEELEILVHCALTSLYYIAPKLASIFVKSNGIQSLLIIVETYYLLCNDCNRLKLLLALRILAKITELNNKKINETIKNSYGIYVINLLCHSIIKKDVQTANDQELLTYCFHILSFLYDEKPIIRDPSLNNLIKYFRRVISPKSCDSCLNPRAIISAIYLLWQIILVDSKKARYFIKMEGVYLLLDIIDTNTLPVKIMGLGCLADICEDPFCVPFLLTWRGGNDKKRIFVSLLANVFREECLEIGVNLDSNCIIKDTSYPLMGKAQIDEISSPNKPSNSYFAISDMIGSARPKIYALLQLINVRYEETVEITNEHYKISSAPVPRKDKIILHLAQNYFALKLSETWHELEQDLMISKITPIDLDVELLVLLTDQMQIWNESIKKEQEAILKSEIEKDKTKEQELYEILRNCRLQGAIEAIKQMKYIARTTDKMFLSAHKQRQKQAIEKSLADVVDVKDIIRTYKTDANFTVVVPQIYNLKYNQPVVESSKEETEEGSTHTTISFRKFT